MSLLILHHDTAQKKTNKNLNFGSIFFVKFLRQKFALNLGKYC